MSHGKQLCTNKELKAVCLSEIADKKTVGKGPLSTRSFYNPYYGHNISDLQFIRNTLDKKTSIVYLAGDSSFDNKHWLKWFTVSLDDNVKLDPAISSLSKKVKVEVKQDIAWQLNQALPPGYVCLNAAVEEGTIGERIQRQQQLRIQRAQHFKKQHFKGQPMPFTHDDFIRNNIRDGKDVLVVSLGGNDIALAPTWSTMFNMAKMIYMNSMKTLNAKPKYWWGGAHFIRMFSENLESCILGMIGNRKPRLVVVSMIYFPDEDAKSKSWANTTLHHIGYDSTPTQLQTIIRQLFKHVVSKIRLEDGIKVVGFPMFETLDGKTSSDYVERVEPSAQGGAKLAKALAKIIAEN